jgi:site-specific recombinase XerD
MAYELQKISILKELVPQREPYWAAPIQQGQYIGYRKIDAQRGSWIARAWLPDEGVQGKQKYKALGLVTKEFDFDKAKVAAAEWFKQLEAGIKTDEVVTVADACRAYVADLRTEKREDTAHDAEKRFERTVYENDLGGKALTKLRTPHLKAWREKLGLNPSTSNRTLTALKAALNLAVAHRQVPASAIIEWRQVEPLKGGKRRELYLDRKERRALLKAASNAVRDLLEAAMLTGARAGELVKAVARQFDARQKKITFIGKTGTRTVSVSPPAMALFKRLSENKAPGDLLLVRDDGNPWSHSDWDGPVREAANAAGLPSDPRTGTCLYTLRHSFITQAIESGMTTLDVARYVGTSLVMIDKHYGQTSKSSAARLAKVKMV